MNGLVRRLRSDRLLNQLNEPCGEANEKKHDDYQKKPLRALTSRRNVVFLTRQGNFFYIFFKYSVGQIVFTLWSRKTPLYHGRIVIFERDAVKYKMIN